MIEIYEAENDRISEYDDVTLTRSGNITEIKYLSHKNTEMKIKKLSAYGYLNIETGEYYESCGKDSTREDNYWGVKRSMKILKNYINSNITTNVNVHWVTLTYAQRSEVWDEPIPMRDTNRLYLDFQETIRRLRQDYPEYKLEYVAVAEPQRSGSWHMHVFLIWDRKAPFIPNDDLRYKYWGQGYVQINYLNPNCDNIGAYFSVYLTDIELDKNDKDIPETLIVERTLASGKTKKFIKGGRLKFYPAFFNLYRCSRGIKKPDIYKDVRYGSIEKEDLGACTFKKALMVTDKEEKYSVRIVYEYYNSKREIGKDE